VTVITEFDAEDPEATMHAMATEPTLHARPRVQSAHALSSPALLRRKFGLTGRISPAFGYPAKDHALAWRPEMRI
jgi:hypothetical protein